MILRLVSGAVLSFFKELFVKKYSVTSSFIRKFRKRVIFLESSLRSQNLKGIPELGNSRKF